jgi:hypothetical protein
MSAMETESLSKNTWHILTKRLSLASMFAEYIEEVPSRRPYYGLEIAGNGLMSIVPSAIWPGKPKLEQLAMSRAYENGVIDRNSRTSAKPPFIVDAYLSGGAIAVAIALFLFGVLASLASRLAERWFGGYFLGGLVYLGLFSIFWEGNAFEYFFNDVFWGFMTMGALFVGGRMIGIIVPQRQQEKVAA